MQRFDEASSMSRRNMQKDLAQRNLNKYANDTYIYIYIYMIHPSLYIWSFKFRQQIEKMPPPNKTFPNPKFGTRVTTKQCRCEI